MVLATNDGEIYGSGVTLNNVTSTDINFGSTTVLSMGTLNATSGAGKVQLGIMTKGIISVTS